MTAKLDKNRHGPRIEWDIVLETATLRMNEAERADRASYSAGA